MLTTHHSRNVVLLLARGKVVAHVSKTQFMSVFEAPSHLLKTIYPGPLDSTHVSNMLHLEEFECDTDESVVRFLAHWMYNCDVRIAMEETTPENRRWCLFFFDVLNFCVLHGSLNNPSFSITTNIHNGLIHYFIDFLREQKVTELSDLLDEAFFNGAKRSPLTVGSTKEMDSLMAALVFHHRPTRLYCRDWTESTLEWVVMDKCSDYHESLIEQEGSLENLPHDPLAKGWEDYLLYHKIET